jgi:hypothetical protein
MGKKIVATLPSQQSSFLPLQSVKGSAARRPVPPAVRTGIASSRLEDIRSSSAGLALEQRGLEVHYGVRHCQGLLFLRLGRYSSSETIVGGFNKSCW